MPGAVSIAFLHARKQERLPQNLRRVTDNMVDTILASKTMTVVAPHTFIPVIDGVNIKKVIMWLETNLIVDCDYYTSLSSAVTNLSKATGEPDFYLCTCLLTVMSLNKCGCSLPVNVSINCWNKAKMCQKQTKDVLDVNFFMVFPSYVTAILSISIIFLVVVS